MYTNALIVKFAAGLGKLAGMTKRGQGDQGYGLPALLPSFARTWGSSADEWADNPRVQQQRMDMIRQFQQGRPVNINNQAMRHQLSPQAAGASPVQRVMTHQLPMPSAPIGTGAGLPGARISGINQPQRDLPNQ